MDMKVIVVLALVAIALLAFASVAVAAPGGNGLGFGMRGNGNETACPCADGWNASGDDGFGKGMMGRGRGLNATASFNETAHEEFETAVLSGDYTAAKQLHDEFGFGGRMFERLNETTFATYSQMRTLEEKARGMAGTLMKEIGIAHQANLPMHPMEAFDDAPREFGHRGMGMGRGMMQPREFANSSSAQ